MGWEKRDSRRVYYRAFRDSGKVRKVHCGRGAAGEAAAEVDALHRQQRLAEAAAEAARKESISALENEAHRHNELCTLLTCSMLLVSGHHKVKREWRSWREGRRALRA